MQVETSRPEETDAGHHRVYPRRFSHHDDGESTKDVTNKYDGEHREIKGQVGRSNALAERDPTQRIKDP